MAASVEDILDEILMSDNDSETEQLVESAGLQRVTDIEEELEINRTLFVLVQLVWQLRTACLTRRFGVLVVGNQMHLSYT